MRIRGTDCSGKSTYSRKSSLHRHGFPTMFMSRQTPRSIVHHYGSPHLEGSLVHFPGHGGQQVRTGAKETEPQGRSQSQRRAKDQSTSFTSSSGTKRPSFPVLFPKMSLGRMQGQPWGGGGLLRGARCREGGGQGGTGGAGVLLPRDPGRRGGVEGAGRRLRAPGSRRPPTAAAPSARGRARAGGGARRPPPPT